jgi:hypothetical protein
MNIKRYFIHALLAFKLLLYIRYREYFDKESIFVLNHKAKAANNMRHFSILKYVNNKHYEKVCSCWTDLEGQLLDRKVDLEAQFETIDDFFTSEYGMLSIGSFFAFYGNKSYL